MAPSSAWQRLPGLARELFDVELEAGTLARLERFVDLVTDWSSRMNLIAARSRDEIVFRHLLDSLAPLRLLGGARVIADFGSGAGFPAIPLALASPQRRFHLIESRRKRCSFLRHVVRSLAIDHARVWECRGESWSPPEPIDAALGRALSIETLRGLAQRVLPIGGRMVVMRKQDSRRNSLAGFEERGALSYRLPDGQAHQVVLFERVSATDCST